MVGVTKIQRGNAGYWLAAVAEGGEDYYNQPGEAPGEWVGKLAAELGMSGQVDADGYCAILEGTDPTSSRQLLKRPETHYRRQPDGTEKRIEPVLGYDVRFSCPKSISIVYALGDEEIRGRVLAIVNDAVRQGLAHLEREACVVQRGERGEEIEFGSGFVGMAFRHRMSRAGDPALHVHVVLSNLTRAADDGKWLSLASPKGRNPLWTHGKSAGVIFQAAVRAGFIREFGWEFEPVTNGYADLKGFAREVIDALSTRSKEIATWLKQHGLDSVKAAQAAAYRTRANKDYGVDEDDRRAEWIATAEPFDVTPEIVGRMAAAGEAREPHPITAEDVDASLRQLEETFSHFDRRTLLWALCDQLPEGANGVSLDAAVDDLLTSDRVVCVHESDGPLALPHYTTPRLASLEESFLEGALRGANAGAGLARAANVQAALAARPHLGEDQRELILRLTTGGEHVVAVAARPGTGKTTALEGCREAWERAGFEVRGCATAKTASGELKDAGIDNATSIRALLNRAEELRAQGIMPLAAGTVIVVDEASTTSTPDLEALRLLAVECGGKLVVIGDDRQIGAVGPGGLFGTFIRLTEPVRLTTIRRQRRPQDQRLVALVHEGRGSEALDLLRTEGRLIVCDDIAMALNAQLADWHRDFATGADAVMIARRNRDVDHLNDQARELRREEGSLGEAEVIVGERAFAAGDRVQTRINREGVSNRERWDVLDADAAARTLTLRRVGGDERTVTLGSSYLDRRRNDNGPALEYAYARTKFGAQGMTVDRAYPLLDEGASLEQELVAISRGREVASVYVVASSELVDPDLGPGKRDLTDALHDIRATIEREGNDYSAYEVSMRRQLEAMTPRQLASSRARLLKLGRVADPMLRRSDQLDSLIDKNEGWVARLGREREALQALRSPPAEELARVSRAEQKAIASLKRHREEREAMPEGAATAEPKPTSPEARLEAVLIERRIEQLARRAVRAAQLEPIDPVYDALGPFPHQDPDKALAWGGAAHSIAVYRLRQGIEDPKVLLGKEPRGAAARAEWVRVQRQLQEAQRDLQWVDRSVGREAAGIAIGR